MKLSAKNYFDSGSVFFFSPGSIYELERQSHSSLWIVAKLPVVQIS